MCFEMPLCLFTFLEILVMSLWVWQLPGEGCALWWDALQLRGVVSPVHPSCPDLPVSKISSVSIPHPLPRCLQMDGYVLWEGHRGRNPSVMHLR